MKNNLNLESLQAALAKQARLTGEIPVLQATLETRSGLLKQLEETGDLASPETLDQIIREQAFVALLPRRIAAREAALADGEAQITTAANEFIRAELNPRARQLESRALAQARKAMSPHFADEAELNRAAQGSDLVRSIGNLTLSVTAAPFPNAPGYAQRALANWVKLDAIEAKLS